MGETIKLQHLLMPQAGLCLQRDMYFRLDEKVRLMREHRALTFGRHGIAWFDTYFNGFSIEKWRKCTMVGQISVTLFLKGKFDQLYAEKELTVTEFQSSGVEAVTLPFQSYEEKGMYFVRLEALEKGSEYWGGYYSAEMPEPLSGPVANVRIVHQMLFAANCKGGHHFQDAARTVVQKVGDHRVTVVILATEPMYS